MSSAPFELLDGEDFLTIKLNGFFGAKSGKLLDEKLKPIEEGPALVISCEALTEFDLNGVRCLLLLTKECKTKNRGIRMVSVSPVVMRFLDANGVRTALPIAMNLKAALTELGLTAKEKTLDVGFINPFLDATINTLQVQAGIKAVPGTIFREEAPGSTTRDIAGVIALESEAFKGSIDISFPEPTFLKIMSRMLGENCTAINRELEDGAAEFTNIVFCQAKLVLNEKGYGIGSAIPSVKHGKERPHSSQRVVIPFKTEMGDFVVEICPSG